MNGCSLGPPGTFFHSPSSILVLFAILSELIPTYSSTGLQALAKLTSLGSPLHFFISERVSWICRSICGALRLNFFPISLLSLLALQDACEPLVRIFATIREHSPAVVLLEDLDCIDVVEESSLLTATLPPLLSGLTALLELPRVLST